MSRAQRRATAQLAPTGISPRGRAQQGERQCVVCRRVCSRNKLLQLAQADGQADNESRRRTGRRRYVCVALACLTRALATGSPDASFSAVRALVETRVLSLLGMARRQGELIAGAQAIVSRPLIVGSVVFVAADCAPRTARQVKAAFEDSDVHDLFTQAALARATGTTSGVAVAIRAGRIAMQAVYWLRVWYEAQASDGRSHVSHAPAARESTRGNAHNTQRLSPETSTD